MKKILFILLTILITFPLMGQGLRLQQNHRKQLMRNFISIDTIDTKDTVYIVEYRYHENNFYNINRPCFYGYNNDFRYSYYNWHYNDFYWSYNNNWYNDNYHRHYSKPRPQRPIRQRTIATRVNQPERKREYVRPVRTTDTRYNRPQSTTRPKQMRSTNTRSHRTYDRPVNRQTSTYSKPSSNQRRYNTPARSSNQRNNTVRSSNSSNNRNGSTTKNSSSNRSSSGNRGRR